MIPKRLTAAAAVSATLLSASNAFLIPPELSETDIAFAQEVASDINPLDNNNNNNNKLDPITASASRHQLIELACPGCPVLVKDRHHNSHHPKVLTDKPNHLELDFKIEHISDTSGDRLLVNGFELYPNADPLRGELWAGQVLEGAGPQPKPVKDVKEWVEKMDEVNSDHEHDSDHDSDHEDNKKHKNRKHKNRKHRNRHPKTLPQNLGFGLRTSLPQASSDPADALTLQEIIDLNLQILEVGTAFVSGIPSVEIKLLQDSKTQKLMIGNIETTTASNEDSGVPVPFMGVAPEEKEEECDNFICRLLEGFREKVKEGKEAWGKKMMGGCHGGHGMGQSVPAVEEVTTEDGERKMPVVEIDIERIDITESEDGTWEIVASPVDVEKEQQVEEDEKIKDLLDEVPPQEESEEGHRGWHGHHHGGMHRYEHSWGQLLKSITAHVLLPVLVGIIAGVSVSLYVFSILPPPFFFFSPGR